MSQGSGALLSAQAPVRISNCGLWLRPPTPDAENWHERRIRIEFRLVDAEGNPTTGEGRVRIKLHIHGSGLNYRTSYVKDDFYLDISAADARRVGHDGKWLYIVDYDPSITVPVGPTDRLGYDLEVWFTPPGSRHPLYKQHECLEYMSLAG